LDELQEKLQPEKSQVAIQEELMEYLVDDIIKPKGRILSTLMPPYDIHVIE
jgi:hypothetical protein